MSLDLADKTKCPGCGRKQSREYVYCSATWTSWSWDPTKEQWKQWTRPAG